MEGLSKLQSMQDAERNQAKALGKAQARVRQLQVHLRAAQAELALALPLAQVCCTDSASVTLAISGILYLAMMSSRRWPGRCFLRNIQISTESRAGRNLLLCAT